MSDQVLADTGLVTTNDITAALTAELTPMAVRERLWVLMGLDNVVEERDRQLIDQDADTGEWGLPGQLGHSERGRIPDDVNTLVQRIEDEHVRQALARGCTRETIAQVLGIHFRTTFHKEKRANAYDFPLDAIDGRGGRPPDEDGRHHQAFSGSTADESTPDGQRHTVGNQPKTPNDADRRPRQSTQNGAQADARGSAETPDETDDVRSLIRGFSGRFRTVRVNAPDRMDADHDATLLSHGKKPRGLDSGAVHRRTPACGGRLRTRTPAFRA